ncbi:hypothetical protein QFZ60_002369 [Arthrobacter sp. B2I5]|nr:hypothetical protein [Arthrobacter sp. B2I5]
MFHSAIEVRRLLNGALIPILACVAQVFIKMRAGRHEGWNFIILEMSPAGI